MLPLKERHPEGFTPRTDCCADGGASLYYYIATAVVAAGTAYAQYETGQMQKAEYRARVKEEQAAAKEREIARRAKLLKALAARNVASAAGGTALEGTDIALVNKDFKEYSADTMADEAMTSARTKSLRAAGKSAGRIGTIQASTTLFAAAASMGSIKSPTPHSGTPGAGAYTKPAQGGPYLMGP